MPAKGRKPTAAMPAAPTHGYRCWKCPLGPDLQPPLINGYATPGDAYRAFKRHEVFTHPAGDGIEFRAVGR